ncbi:hypothetical protein QR680_017727 [Steinernema hermaphroditum]|uniref:Uncharacterized protein n=1 Tax=Steinernema hermaphroditum TaxID=289476 RepID=A0AA39HHT5_9BILA|nr:hypothetical protein QR680_017727 [Steinernema hermaphroditum]
MLVGRSIWLLATILALGDAWNSVRDIMRRKSRKSPPVPADGSALQVKIGFYLESLGNFRETQMSFDVDLYLYMSWQDPHLNHSGPGYVMVNDDLVRSELWLPDLYFANARSAHFHHVTVPNFNLFIAPDGTVAYSSRVTLNVACNLNLINYPMDRQNCYIRALSYAYIAKMVNITWFRTNPLLYNPEIGLPEFGITDILPGYCNGTYRYAIMEGSQKIDQFSCLTANIHLARSIGYNLVQSYIPTGLIVIISWVSFWIDRRAVPARVTLSFTTLVSLTTLGNGVRFSLPQVSYAKAIDFWFGACMLFVFCALLEFALVNSFMRKSDKYEKLSKKFAADKNDRVLPMSVSALLRSHEKMQRERKGSLFPVMNGMREYSNPLARMSPASRRQKFVSRTSSKVKFEDERPKGNGNSIEMKEKGSTGKNNPIMMTDDEKDKESNALLDSLYDNLSVKDPEKAVFPDEPMELVDDDSPMLFRKSSSEEPEWAEHAHVWATRPRPKRHSVAPNPELSEQYAEVSSMFSRRALNIDKSCRYLFPALFIIFNFFYWSIYTRSVDDFADSL